MTARNAQITLFLLASSIALLMLLGPVTAASEAAQCSGASTPAYKMGKSDAASVALCLINKERSSHGLKPLKVDRKQQKAAKKHNKVMIKKDCFDHQCPGEPDLVGRMENAGYLPCECSWSVGENIAWGSGTSASPANIVDAWMDSAPHRANILSKTFDETGIAITDGSPGGDKSAATYTMDFGHKS